MTGGQGCKGNTNPNITYPHCPGQTDLEYITEFSMWVIIGSPLVVASDIRNMTDIMKTVLFNTEVCHIVISHKCALHCSFAYLFVFLFMH